MLTLTPEDIRLGCQAADWREALSLASQELEKAGRTTPEYHQGLLDRENQSSTVLGNGIAIPHGTPDSREYVRSTGIRVLQFPEGITWHDGAKVHVLVTIAAQSDEHLDILRHLTRVLDKPGLAERLANATDRNELLAALSRTPATARCDRETLLLGLPTTDTRELALSAAARLQALGCVEPGFIAGLVAQAPVALGRGLWLAHFGEGVNQPALALATPSKAQENLSGVLCLATQGEDTQPLLEQIDHLLTQPTPLGMLSAEAILARLAGEQADAVTREVRLLNAHGLHARPAKQLVQVAREQAAPLKLRLLEGDAQAISATSLTRVISLGARRGQTLVVSASGENAQTSVDALAEAIEQGLGEPVTPLHSSERERTATDQTVQPIQSLVPDEPLKAVAASPGLAVAPAFVLRMPAMDYADKAEDPSAENQRLNQAIDEAFSQLEALIKQAEGGEAGPILAVHAEMLRDEDLHEAATEAIDEGASAEAGWWQAIDTAASAQEALADRLLAERAADLRDVGRRVLANLCGVSMPTPPDEPYVLVADDLGPSDVARLDTQRVRGLVTAKGGATSHSAILARALGLPAVVGAGERLLTLDDGVELVVDGERGCIVPAPGSERRERLQRRLEQLEELQRDAHEARLEPARTRDNHTVEVCANLGNTAHTPEAVERGADGIGLLRTEFIFMAHSEAPDQATQEAEYRKAFDALDGLPLVARTLDVGGDKPLDYWPLPAEDNPFLGLRGIRLSLTRPEILETQLRALLSAAGERPLRIMFPMVKDLAEFRAAKALVDKLREEIHAPDVQVGVMIEIPSSALLAHSLAAEVDFFSIGTNDLTQYTLAIDRGHAELSAESDGLHPAVLRLIAMTVEAAHAQNRWVGICGELGSDPQAIPVLLGLGVDEFSVTSRRVPLVKACIRNLTLDEARDQAQKALGLATASEVRELLEAL
ncbi:phosphoenolpyruvate--protein phosphotransferase [Marinobacter nanhaiticus D15-8W]|uniref:phosphoenolpyruvate--protein phosphotransferase n=1 Tax=Marinobacter nanhaiticus D15-8W TaxID=626887 RepID=N6VXY7_9GAMM|nr:phosphoenolpyruvate--protein phosphotransferase [Marinobacter nanhaiticus]ENO15140.1 phosphoenolpyruvate--protein phosphotransferase [Marinobacter nanhaiticus D15-8W]BES69161.1 phosphoenolpyruvate--protein phosphotransferase [Marinobacter nanhaiticus D15-8W]